MLERCSRSGLHGIRWVYERRTVCPLCRASWSIDSWKVPEHQHDPAESAAAWETRNLAPYGVPKPGPDRLLVRR